MAPAVWALADLHFSFGVPNKGMEVFGEQWTGWTEKIQSAWRASVAPEDLVLIPGDISWAMRLEEVVPDLQWIHELPGTKVMIRGNHDFWWTSLAKVEKILPSSIHLIQNNAFHFGDISVAGTRLWDSQEYSFRSLIAFQENTRAKPLTEFSHNPEEDERIFLRELGRLETSLKALKPTAKVRLVMTHYPPIGLDLADSRVSLLLDKYGVQACVFGHLHQLKPTEAPLFGVKNGVHYSLTSCDYLQFKPLKIV